MKKLALTFVALVALVITGCSSTGGTRLGTDAQVVACASYTTIKPFYPAFRIVVQAATSSDFAQAKRVFDDIDKVDPNHDLDKTITAACHNDPNAPPVQWDKLAPLIVELGASYFDLRSKGKI